MRTGAPWRDLPPEYGGWSNTHRRFIRWRDAGVWERLLEVCIDEPDLEWPMVDASYVKAHQHAAGARGGNEGIGLTKGGETGGDGGVIPPRVHRKVQRQYDKYLYKLRHLVENAFLSMKQWRGVATRYSKRLSSYLASVQIRCLYTWLKVIS